MNLDLSKATVVASDGGRASLVSNPDIDTRTGGGAVRVDYNVQGGGFVSVRLPVGGLVLPPDNFRLAVKLAGSPAKNTVQVKLVDEDGTSVFWVVHKDVSITEDWLELSGKKRQFWWAWGPNKQLFARVAAIEITVLSAVAQEGLLYLSDLAIEEIPVILEHPPLPVVTASSGQRTAGNVVTNDGTASSKVWRSSTRRSQWLELDLGTLREFGGIIIDWGDGPLPSRYYLQLRTGEGEWRTVDSLVGGLDGAAAKRQYHLLPDSEASGVRIEMMHDLGGRRCEVRRVQLMPLDFGASANAFFSAVAGDARRGSFPCYLLNEPQYWTTAGVEGGHNEGLISLHGIVELGRGGPSLEPFIFCDGSQRVLTWADARHTQSLAAGYLPVPRVNREHDNGLHLSVEAFACGSSTESTMYVTYELVNTSSVRQTGRMYLALRPFMVNPPWQSMLVGGGHSPISEIDRSHDFVMVNGRRAVKPLSRGYQLISSRLADGDIVRAIEERTYNVGSVKDDHGFASAALTYEFDLGPGDTRSFKVGVPLSDQSPVWLHVKPLRQKTIERWGERLKDVDIDVLGGVAKEAIDTLRAQLAYMLISRNGPAISPGKRNYLRSWIRDGALICESLLAFGFFNEVREFIEWYAPHVFPNGRVPCIVDHRGADPVPEHDAQGEFIMLVCRYYRYTKDIALVEQLFPTLEKVAGFIETMRQAHRTAEFEQSDKLHLFGLVDPSISHEGYNIPQSSYFDNVFALVGLQSMAYLASQLSKQAGDQAALAADYARKSATYAAQAQELVSDLVASVDRVMRDHKIDFIPGSATLGDEDACSITVWLDPGPGVLLEQFGPQLRATFERWWSYFLERRARGNYEYTPYELRIVGALIRLGLVERAHEAIEFFLNDRRPHGWRIWAEVVRGDHSIAGYVGDMPHVWVGSDYVRSLLSMFVYERKDREGLIVGRGFSEGGLAAGIKVQGLRTVYGKLSLFACREGDCAVYYVLGNLEAPAYIAVPDGYTEAWADGLRLAIDPVTNTVEAPLSQRIVFLR